MKYFLVLVFFAASLLMSCTSSNQQMPAANQSPGQIIFEANCVSCHGADGKLCVLGAKDLTLSTLSKEEIITIITNGKSTMTPFGSILSQEEINAIAEYVQTFKTK